MRTNNIFSSLIYKSVFALSLAALVASPAFAFGGHHKGGTKRLVYNGIDSIIVHFDETCPTNASWDSNEKKCKCKAGYKMSNNTCFIADKNLCDGANLYWCAVLQICTKDEAACLAECPSDRKCGTTCCGEGNVCVDGDKCCLQDTSGDANTEMCCNATESSGYSTQATSCCESGSSSYIFRKVPGESLETSCCAATVISAPVINEGASSYSCCNYTVYKGVGYQGSDVCCEHEPTSYTDGEGNTFKVCWDEETNCKSYDDCDDGYYCDLTSSTGFYPKKGVCTEIGDTSDTAEIDGLGTLVRSPVSMTYWSAKDWCEAQGKSLIEISDFQCYHDGTNDMIVDWDSTGACCAENKSCSANNSWYKDDQKENYSERIYNILFGFNTKFTVWVASKHQPMDTYYRIRILLSQAFITTRQQAADESYAVCK